jgi:hypothetical protein
VLWRSIRAKGRGFTKRSVTLSDGLGNTSAFVVRPSRFCTPTAFPGEGVTNPDTALLCYKLTRGGFQDYFLPGFLANRVDGYRGFHARAIDSLCVPATVGAGPAGPPRDVYRCAKGPHSQVTGLDVTLTDALGSMRVRQVVVGRWCVPTDIDGGGGTNRLEPGMDLRCDLVKRPRPVAAQTEITVTDRFGSLSLALSKSDSYCVPALEDRD